MADPRVTVGIATYNGARYLPEQLDTIFAQTYQPLDVVCVDDGSTDNTVELLSEYARRYPLRVVTNERNLGLVGNFERVLRECVIGGAEYIALADQDDIWKPAKITTLVNHLGDADLIYNPAEWAVNPDGRIDRPLAFEAYMAYCSRRGSGKPVTALLANNFVISHQVLLTRAVATAAVPFPPGLRFHDHWIALTAARRAGIRFHPADLMIYRRHSASATYVEVTVAGRRGLLAGLDGWRTRHRDFLAEIGSRDALLASWQAMTDFTPAEVAAVARLRRVYQHQLTPGPHPGGLMQAAAVSRHMLFATTAARIRFLLAAGCGSRLALAPTLDAP